MTGSLNWGKGKIMSRKPAGKIIIYVLVAAVVLCAAGLGLFFLISNLQKINLRQSIISECPFTIAGDADWKIYPNNNQAGIIAAVSEHDGQANRMILVLDKSANKKCSSAGAVKSAVLYHDYFRISYSSWKDSWRKLEEKNVYDTDNFIYLRVQYDSNATLTRIKIGTGASDSIDSGYGEGVLFDFSDPFKVTYYIYGGTGISMSQEYDEKRSQWGAVSNYDFERPAYD